MDILIAGKRNIALDFSKGVLVLLMVFYHWVNYFVSTQGQIYTYLRFITPSFIFIAGFLIGNVYPFKYGWTNPRASERLLSRGLKILILFTLLNISANFLVTTNYKGSMPGVEGFINNAGSVYISGNGKASFWVLVPISYLLLLSAGFFKLRHSQRYWVGFVCLILFLGVGFLNVYDLSSANLELLAIGLLGVVLGLSPIETINKWADHPYLIVGLNVVYLIAITLWDVVYYLQVIGVCLSVMLIYLIGLKITAWQSMGQQISLIGTYSLFGYVAQIACLQFLHRTLPYTNLGAVTLSVISFVGAFTLTIVLVNMLHRLRTKFSTMDRLYRLALA